MEHDSGAFAQFYRSALGQVARRLILRRVREIWPDLNGQRVLGYGFAPPYLRNFLGEAERTIALLPDNMGAATAWPTPNVLLASSEEAGLPFSDALFDRVLIVHGLEIADSLRPLMRQLWRVMASDGRLLLVVPNRTSLWTQVERSPFAHGRPFTRVQLGTLLRDSLFAAERWETALLIPPFRSRRLLGSGNSWEAIGRRLWPALAGVHIVEATKSLYALPPPVAAKSRMRKFVRVES
jgi:SAM-dependent methyltransferase